MCKQLPDMKVFNPEEVQSKPMMWDSRDGSVVESTAGGLQLLLEDPSLVPNKLPVSTASENQLLLALINTHNIHTRTSAQLYTYTHN